MYISPNRRIAPSSSRRAAALRRGYTGRHRKTRTKLVGACVQLLLASVLILGTAGQVYGHIEQQTTAVHRDV